MSATITLRQASRLGGHRRPWCARINGRDATYNLSRSFVAPAKTVFGGEWTFELEDGLYECCNRNSKGAERRYFTLVSEGVAQECVADEVVQEWLAQLDVLSAQKEAGREQVLEERRQRDQQTKAERIATDPIANAQAATELAADKAKQAGRNKDQWLPYVRAALTFWGRIQERALADDNTRASFEAANQQISFGREFEALTGRRFELATDSITYAEIEAETCPTTNA